MSQKSPSGWIEQGVRDAQTVDEKKGKIRPRKSSRQEVEQRVEEKRVQGKESDKTTKKRRNLQPEAANEKL